MELTVASLQHREGLGGATHVVQCDTDADVRKSKRPRSQAVFDETGWAGKDGGAIPQRLRERISAQDLQPGRHPEPEGPLLRRDLVTGIPRQPRARLVDLEFVDREVRSREHPHHRRRISRATLEAGRADARAVGASTQCGGLALEPGTRGHEVARDAVDEGDRPRGSGRHAIAVELDGVAVRGFELRERLPDIACEEQARRPLNAQPWEEGTQSLQLSGRSLLDRLDGGRGDRGRRPEASVASLVRGPPRQLGEVVDEGAGFVRLRRLEVESDGAHAAVVRGKVQVLSRGRPTWLGFQHRVGQSVHDLSHGGSGSPQERGPVLLAPWVTASQSPRAWAATISSMGAGATERRRRGMPVASVDLGRRMGAVCVQKGTRLVKNRVDPGRDARAPVSEPGRRARLLRQGQQSVRGRRESIPTPARIS